MSIIPKMQLHNELTDETRVITLYEICKVLEKRHSDAIKMVAELHENKEFGGVRKIRIPTFNPDGSKNRDIETYHYTKKQALMIGARLDSKNIIKLVNKLEELSKPLTFEEMAKQTILLADKKIKELEHKIEKKDEVILAVADLNIKAGDVSFADFAKNLALDGMGRNNVIKFCKARGYLMDNTAPYQPYVNRGYFVRKPSKEKINGEVRYTTYLTPRGSVWLAKIIKAEFEIDDEGSV